VLVVVLELDSEVPVVEIVDVPKIVVVELVINPVEGETPPVTVWVDWEVISLELVLVRDEGGGALGPFGKKGPKSKMRNIITTTRQVMIIT